MDINELLQTVPREITHEYITRRGRRGISYKFQVGELWVTVSVTGTKEKSLPKIVAAALSVWATSTLVSDVPSKRRGITMAEFMAETQDL